MDTLDYPLSVLARGVEFRNLSAASLHVGLSQPQLSRLVARLEEALEMELLDRRVKRLSSWTPQAVQLAELFKQSRRRLEDSIRTLQTNQRAKQVHVGTLEGLADEAVHLCKRMFDKVELQLIFLDVFDRSELEAKFLAGDLDLIVNTRFPGRAKPRFSHTIGYQAVDHMESPSPYRLYSSFEFNFETRKNRPQSGKFILTSNSLYVRRKWLGDYGGSGSMPSPLSPVPKRAYKEVYVFGAEGLDLRVWESVVGG